MLPYPVIDPVAFPIGPLAVRWYSLAYLAGILLGWWLIKKELARKPIANLSSKAIDDIITWAVLGIVGGGRLGYVLFYKPAFYFANPALIFHVWEGGMSFHGGLIGTILAFYFFCRKYQVPFLELMDLLAFAAPIGLFFGRVANFINGELFGRVTDAAVGMVFPHGGDLPRHPSQLYEAGAEGLLLFLLLYILLKYTTVREKIGALSGVFLMGYAAARFGIEFFREPDAFLGFYLGFATMGQLLCTPMFFCGLYLVRKSHVATQKSR